MYLLIILLSISSVYSLNSNKHFHKKLNVISNKYKYCEDNILNNFDDNLENFNKFSNAYSKLEEEEINKLMKKYFFDQRYIKKTEKYNTNKK